MFSITPAMRWWVCSAMVPARSATSAAACCGVVTTRSSAGGTSWATEIAMSPVPGGRSMSRTWCSFPVAFVEEKRVWIERTLRRMREAGAEHPPSLLEDGGQVPFMGERLGLRVRVEPARSPPAGRWPRRGDTLHVSVGEPGPGALRDALERWYRRQAPSDQVERPASTRPPPVQGPATRPCRSAASAPAGPAAVSSTGAMSFNWRLLLAPEEILDYVVEDRSGPPPVHDHSAEFWAELKNRVPDYKIREKWLKRHGQSLRL